MKYGAFYGDKLKVAYPTGSELKYTLTEIAVKLTARLLSIFIPDENGNRPLYSTYNPFYKKNGPDLLQFFEYFDGDTSKGLGASHQTGWTGLVAPLMNLFAHTSSQEFLTHGRAAVAAPATQLPPLARRPLPQPRPRPDFARRGHRPDSRQHRKRGAFNGRWAGFCPAPRRG